VISDHINFRLKRPHNPANLMNTGSHQHFNFQSQQLLGLVALLSKFADKNNDLMSVIQHFVCLA